MAYPPPADIGIVSAPVVPARRSAHLVAGSVLRIIGGVVVGIGIILLGVLISNPDALVSPTNALAAFQVIGTIIIMGIGSILVEVGWAMQTWGVGLILTIERGR